MKHCLFPENGKFYKVNLHCHTTVSDGHMTPAEVKAAYRAAGYDAVAFTDHEALITHDELTDSHFIALNGYETAVKEEQVSTSTHPLLRVHHINFIKRKPNDNVSFCFYPENFTPGNCRAQIPFIRYVGERTTYAYTKEFLSHLIEEAHKNLEEKAEKLLVLRDKLIDGLLKLPYSRLNGDRDNRLPGNANVSFSYVEGESLLLWLDMSGISASTGSACSSNSLEASHVLLAIGVDIEDAHGSLRFSLSKDNTEEEVEEIIKAVKESVERLRAMSPIYPGN